MLEIFDKGRDNLKKEKRTWSNDNISSFFASGGTNCVVARVTGLGCPTQSESHSRNSVFALPKKTAKMFQERTVHPYEQFNRTSRLRATVDAIFFPQWMIWRTDQTGSKIWANDPTGLQTFPNYWSIALKTQLCCRVLSLFFFFFLKITFILYKNTNVNNYD